MISYGYSVSTVDLPWAAATSSRVYPEGESTTRKRLESGASIHMYVGFTIKQDVYVRMTLYAT